MTDKISKEHQEKLEALFNAGAANMLSEPEYWIHGSDEGASYCLECCEKKVERLLKENPDGDYCVDGGYGIDGDYTPFCETCHKLLENSLTDSGCGDEVEHFLLHGFNPKSDDDCRAMSEVINGRGWEPWLERTYRNPSEKESDLRYFDSLHKLCRIILEKS